MSDATDHMAAVRDLARAIHEIATVEVPELDITDEMIVGGTSGDELIETQRDDDWWDAWCEIYDIVERHGGAEVGNSQMRMDVEPHRRYDRIHANTDWTALTVEVYANGDVRMTAEYDAATGPSWHGLYDGRVERNPPDPIQLGREIASAELAVLARATGSDADALDYWQTQVAPGAFTQQRWADVRGVGRQTVNDRKRSAKEALGIEDNV